MSDDLKARAEQWLVKFGGMHAIYVDSNRTEPIIRDLLTAKDESSRALAEMTKERDNYKHDVCDAAIEVAKARTATERSEQALSDLRETLATLDSDEMVTISRKWLGELVEAEATVSDKVERQIASAMREKAKLFRSDKRDAKAVPTAADGLDHFASDVEAGLWLDWLPTPPEGSR